MKYFLTFLFACVLFLTPSFTNAQTAEPASFEYVDTSFPNLVKAYVALNDYDFNDTAVIDAYLMATECDLFEKFSVNEFEWNKLRNTARDYIQKYKSAFPRRLEYIQPIELEAYDFNLGGFKLKQDSVFPSTTKMLTSGNSDKNISTCSSDNLRKIQNYFPLNMLLSFERPFALAFIPVKQDKAESFIKFLEADKKLRQNQRPAFIRIRFKADRWMPTYRDVSDVYANLYGSLESVEVFGDRDLLIKLYEQKL